ncbi:hypothetical protein AALO_G00206410 [Alosa alosa]|uniref:FISNA domain-containing protein n=1 Tax=Alosa alosa TaxID=278164 RepID=A0AAV6G8H4_9TELE|nr:hypothetical protein AALO_G00206410 [Alosa alosa]
MGQAKTFTGGDTSAGHVQQGASGTQSKRTDKTEKEDFAAEHRWTPEEAEIHEKLRSTLKSKFQQLVEGVPNQGDPRLLQEIYTDLYVTKGGGGVNDEHEELNLMKEEKLSLVELIQHFFPEMKDPRIFSSGGAHFIFDDFLFNPRCCDVTEPASVDVLLTNLIEGNLLPSALLWIITRPAAANQIPLKYLDQVTEIRGFNDPQKEEYFRKRISDENVASRTVTHLKSSRSLYIMCHIPVFCWITATVLEKGNLIFYEEDLRECGINVTEASVYSGVCTQIFREEAGLCHGRVFSFVHLSIQEFLAALYVFLCFSNRQRNMPDQQQTSLLSALFRAATLHDLDKTAVDLALQSEKGHLDLFLRFLLGLSLESKQNLLKHLLPQRSSQSDSSEQTVQYIKQKIRDEHYSNRMINLVLSE